MKIHSRFYLITSWSTFFVLMASCSLSEELDKISDINSIEATGSFNANVLNETLNLSELITQDNLDLKEDLKGNYSFGFEKSSDYKIESIIFPKITANTVEVKLPLDSNPSVPAGEYPLEPPLTSTFSIPKPTIGDTDFPEGFKINKIKLKTGAKISLILINEFNSKARITVTIPNLTIGGLPYSKVFDNIAAGVTSNLEINDLDGYLLDTSGEMGIEIATTIIKNFSGPITGDKMTISTTIDIADHHEFVEGFFGEIVLNPDPITVNVDLPDGFVKDATSSEMIIKEAKITLTVDKKDLTLPIDLDLIYNGTSLQKTVVGDSLKFTIKENLNILQLDQLVLTPIVTLNKASSSGFNKLMDSSSLIFNAKVDIPMDITVKDLIFKQEVKNSLFEAEIKESDFEFKEGKVSLLGSVSNQIPLGAFVEVWYSDIENGNIGELLFDEAIEIKQGTGKLETVIPEVYERVETILNVEVTKEKLDRIKKYPFQVVKVKLNGEGKIKSTQGIKFKIGIKAKGTLTTKI